MTSPLVLDTNIVLDLFVFGDEAALPLRAALEAGGLRWLATPEMRSELARVLAYPKIAPRVAYYGLSADAVLAQFDRFHETAEAPAKAPVTCADADDQKFIDLAVAHQAVLLSKDNAVLSMARRLVAHRVQARARWA